MLPSNSLRLILKPIVRLFVRNAHSIQEFTNLAKILFVECAKEELLRGGDKASLSRVSAMTGLNRRDVTSIAEQTGTPAFSGASVLARVIARWESDKRLKALTYSGPDSEFYRLVAAVSNDIHAGTILTELCRAGLAELKGSRVSLIGREAIVGGDVERGLALLARETTTLFDVVTENVIDPQPIKNLHLRTEFDNIDQRKLPLLRKWLLEQGQDFHRRARAFFVEHDLDMSSGAQGENGGGRVVLTTFGMADAGESATRNSQKHPLRKQLSKKGG